MGKNLIEDPISRRTAITQVFLPVGAALIAAACGAEVLGTGRIPLSLSDLLKDEGKYKQNGRLIKLTLDDNLLLQTRSDIRKAVKEEGWLKVHGKKQTNMQVLEMALRDSLSGEQKTLFEEMQKKGGLPSGTKLNLVGATFPVSEPEGYFAFDIQEIIPPKQKPLD